MLEKKVLKQRLNNLIKSIVRAPAALADNLLFILVLYLYVFRGIFRWIGQRKLLKWLPFGLIGRGLSWLLIKITKRNDGKVSKEYLIELAFRNMGVKRNRTIVTIGGMALGVGAIVFLVSVGYGLEKMVISKVTKLNELRMADITSGQLSNLEMNDQVMEKIKGLEGVEEVIPLVSMVSKVQYNGSILDVMSMGVEERYIKAMAPSFLAGEEFKDRDLDFSYSSEGQKVLGASSLEETKNNEIEKVVGYRIVPGRMVTVWKECNTESGKIGYAMDTGEEVSGERQWGEKYYYSTGEKNEAKDNINGQYSSWISTVVPIWEGGEGNSVLPKLDAFGQQVREKGCVMEKEVLVSSEVEKQVVGGEVLGINSDEATASAVAAVEASESATANIKVVKDEAGNEWVEYASDGQVADKINEVAFSGPPAAEAYISSGMLRLLGMTEAKEAIGKVFSVYYIITDGTVAGINGRAQSVETNYTIKGVVDGANSNYYYFHLADAKRLGIKNYSQMSVVVKDKEALAGVRKSIETMGFKTTSAADTVTQIESIFGNLRLLLGLLGTIALAVASLGMFNTMTVSLLERTREVGVMKSIGMLSDEVKELFLAESLIMGIGGGTFGVLMGFLAGKILSLVLTSISMLKGQGGMDITYIPWFFVLFIIGVSFVVGVLTGWYPSKRARQISALNALRYE